MSRRFWVGFIVLTVAFILACNGKGDCGRKDGCFGDGDFGGKPSKAPASSPAK